MMPFITPPADGWLHFIRSWLTDAGLVALFNSLIALVVSGLSNKPFLTSFYASQIMGLSIYLCTATPLKWRVGRHQLTPLKIKLGFVLLGSLLGTGLGLGLTRAWLGSNTWRFHLDHPMLYISISLLIMGLNIAYFSYRKRLQVQTLMLEQTKRLQIEAQLRLLQAQLEPHMLFNVLANLHTLIGSDSNKAQTLLESLIDYLRSGVQANNQLLHSLQNECRFLERYLSLQQQRFGARVTYRFELPEDCRAIQIPPLLLQPLVENAMKYGVEPALNGGYIEVAAKRIGDQIVLKISNTACLKETSSTEIVSLGTGLRNVRERLQLCFGQEARLDFQTISTDNSSPPTTQVTLTFNPRTNHLATPI